MNETLLVQEEPRGPSQLYEIQVTANGQTRIPLPDVQQLRSQEGQRVIIKGIRLITPEVLARGPLSGLVTAPLAELQKISLTLYCEGWEKGQLIPLLTMNDMATPAGTFPHRYQPTRFANWQNVDWSKSFLFYSNGTSSANSPYAVLFDVLYIRLDTQGKVITTAM
jgi:hypothetical protein